MTDIVIPAGQTVQFDPDSAGNIVQNTSTTEHVFYSFENDQAKKWFVLRPNGGTIRIDRTTYFKASANVDVTIASDKA